jgi:hypothetical protein
MIELPFSFVVVVVVGGGVLYVKVIVDAIHIFYAPKKKVFFLFLNIIVIECKQRESVCVCVREREKESERNNVGGTDAFS